MWKRFAPTFLQFYSVRRIYTYIVARVSVQAKDNAVLHFTYCDISLIITEQ